MGNLKRGSKGPEVAQVQRALLKISAVQRAMAKAGKVLAGDGDFGPTTELAFNAWALSVGAPADGVCDELDFQRLHEEAAQRVDVQVVAGEGGLLPEPPAVAWDRLGVALDFVSDGAWSKAVETGVAQPAGPRAALYGPGRGLWLNKAKLAEAVARGQVEPVELAGAPGAWVTSRGPGGLGRSANLQSGAEVPTFHCSSFTNWLAGVAVGLDEQWTHTGNMPSLDRVLSETGTFSYGKEFTVQVCGMGQWFQPIIPNGSTAKRHNLKGRGAARYLDTVELWERLPELPGLLWLGQSSKLRSGLWKYEHHTVFMAQHPNHPDRWIRVAADGGRGGKYSGTPMDVEVITNRVALEKQASLLYFAHALVGVRHEAANCPITREI